MADQSEKEKWNDIFRNLPVSVDDVDHERRFGLEFSHRILELLPEGGKTLEAGSGEGKQSLMLARTGKFQVSLLDFSIEALKHGRILFEREGLPVTLIEGDAFVPGESEYDLVFNAGVLEHYTFEEQVQYLKSMASHSRKYVMVLVPNLMCYWYWVWRIQKTARDDWEYGNEIPFSDLSILFKEAGIRFLGYSFWGQDWSESFILSLKGISPELCQQLLEIQRNAYIPLAQKSYLIAGLGCVDEACQANPQGWQLSPVVTGLATPEKITLQAESVGYYLKQIINPQLEPEEQAARITELEQLLPELKQTWELKDRLIARVSYQLRHQSDRIAEQASTLEQQSARITEQASQLEQQSARITEQATTLEQQFAKITEQATTLEQQFAKITEQDTTLEQLSAKIVKLAQQAADLKQTSETKDGLLAQQASLINQQNQQVAELKQQITASHALIDEIHRGRGWRWLRALWRIRLALLPNNSPQFRFVRWLSHKLKKTRSSPGRKETKHGKHRWRFSLNIRMSWYAFAFNRFKQMRLKQVSGDLRKLHVPAQSGLVSIILPVYNGGKMVGESLESILAQTYPHFEVIAINDGSTDNTAEVLEEYTRRDPRIRVFHQTNCRLPRTLTRGFRMAKGQYLTWTSDDNHFKPNYLERMVNELRQRPWIDMVYANQDIIGEDGQPLKGTDWFKYYQKPPGSEHIYLPTDPSELNTYANNYVGAAFLYQCRTAWLLGDYCAIRFTAEDYDYWMQANSLLQLRHTRFRKPVYEYRFHQKSLTAQDKELGITRNRVKLMVFDNFRRDFYLSPLCWLIQATPNDPIAQQVADQVKRLANLAGQQWIDPERVNPDRWPRLWAPSVYLAVTSNPDQIQAMPEGLPPNTFKAILLLGKSLPPEVPVEWDFCLDLSELPDPPRLAKDYQGWVTSPDPKVLFAAIDIRARTNHLRLIEQELANPPETKFQASIIICTYRRHKTLVNAIRSAGRQTLLLDNYEVIVVNNDPDDAAVADLIKDLKDEYFSAAPDHLRLVDCRLSGLSHARNAGIAEAQGAVLCFLDDDATADEHWLEYTCQAFHDHPQAGVIGGHIRLVLPEPRPAAVPPGWEHYWSQMITGYQEYTEVIHWYDFPWGANWCARRQALVEAGGFRTRYGRRKNDFGGGEEIVAAALIQKLGYTIAILPQSEVKHIPDPQRFTFEDVHKTIRAGMRVHYEMQKDLYLPMYFTLWENLKSIASEWRKYWKVRKWSVSNDLRRRELSYALAARYELLWDQAIDLLARFRRPISTQG